MKGIFVGMGEGVGGGGGGEIYGPGCFLTGLLPLDGWVSFGCPLNAKRGSNARKKSKDASCSELLRKRAGWGQKT